MPGQFKGRTWAYGKIREAKHPMMEAKRLVAWFRTKDLAGTVDEGLDFSDVQEIRVKLIQRDGILDQPQAMLLNRIGRMIAARDMTAEAFTAMASAVLGMKPALAKSHREAA